MEGSSKGIKHPKEKPSSSQEQPYKKPSAASLEKPVLGTEDKDQIALLRNTNAKLPQKPAVQRAGLAGSCSGVWSLALDGSNEPFEW